MLQLNLTHDKALTQIQLQPGIARTAEGNYFELSGFRDLGVSRKRAENT